MRHCPTCGHPYSDPSLKFCLQDGAKLTDGPPFDPEAETLNLDAHYETKPIELGLEVIVQLEGKGKQIFRNNQFAGTRGEKRGLEGFSIRIDPHISGLTLKYTVHVWDPTDKRKSSQDTTAHEGEWVGARKGESCNLSGFTIEPIGELAGDYEISYKAHISGWLEDTPFFINGDFCGVRTKDRRIEGIQVGIVRKR